MLALIIKFLSFSQIGSFNSCGHTVGSIKDRFHIILLVISGSELKSKIYSLFLISNSNQMENDESVREKKYIGTFPLVNIIILTNKIKIRHIYSLFFGDVC